MPLDPFDFDPRTRVVFGSGAARQLGELAAQLSAKRVLLVSDQGLQAAGHASRAAENLQAAGLEVFPFLEVHENPTTDDIDRGVEFARPLKIDLIVGLGGGSSLDCAKGVNFLLTNGGRMADYKGTGRAKLPMLPMIAMPTTSGTGSEAQSYAVIADAQTHLKMACGDKKAACRIAILDPELTLTMPRSVTAVTGIDAISHALETAVTTRRNPISNMYALAAWKLLQAFGTVLRYGNALEERGQMQLGAFFAGAAIENSMLGATHALANPLSARFGLVHGVAISVMLPHVLRYNSFDPLSAEIYQGLASEIGLCERSDPAGCSRLIERIREFSQQADLPVTLRECGVDEGSLAEMAEDAAQQWTAQFNPRPVDVTTLRDLYFRAWRGTE